MAQWDLTNKTNLLQSRFLPKMLLQFYQILIVIVLEKLKFETDQFILWNSSKMFETISIDTET